MAELTDQVKQKTQKMKKVFITQGGKVVRVCKKGWYTLRIRVFESVSKYKK